MKTIAFVITWAVLVVAMPTTTEAGLVAYWNFNEGVGGTLGDSSANNNDGTLVGAVTWVTGHTGGGGDYALDFAGTDADYVVVADHSSLHINSTANKSFTIAAWLYNHGSHYGNIYCHGINGARRISWQTEAFPQIDMCYIWSDDANGPRQGYSAMTTLNTWQHIAVVCDGVNIKTYLDGVETSSGAANTGLSAWGDLVYIGKAVPDYGQIVNGVIDDLVIFDSAEDVASIMNGTHADMGGGVSATPGTLIYGK